jgi:two-component system sensor kinase FixL
MPHRYSVDHDNYLYNYLSTGIKRVMGSGRDVTGMKRDGSEFPLNLSISEVIEDGYAINWVNA